MNMIQHKIRKPNIMNTTQKKAKETAGILNFVKD